MSLPVRRIARAVVVGCAAALSILHGCFVEIADPVPLINDASTDSGGSANGGSSAGSGGSSATGGSGGSSGGTGGSSASSSGGTSASGSGGTAGAACDATSCILPHADAACATDGRCVVTACNPGFLDCNGNPTDGCELGAAAADDLQIDRDGGDAEAGDAGVTYLIPKLSGVPNFFADAGVYVWNDLSPIRFATACPECDNPPNKPGGLDGVPIVYPGRVPQATVHIGYFRVGHYQSSLFVLATVWDSEIIDETTTFDAGAEAGPDAASDAGILPGADAEHEDGIELMIDAPDPTCSSCQNYQQYDHHLFIGASGRMVQYVNSTKPSGPSLNEVIVKAERIPGGACYVIEAELTESYIGPLTVAPGATFGFAIAVNDWRTLSPGTLPQRVYQVFWKKPGTTYGFVVTGFPQVEFGP